MKFKIINKIMNYYKVKNPDDSRIIYGPGHFKKANLDIIYGPGNKPHKVIYGPIDSIDSLNNKIDMKKLIKELKEIKKNFKKY